ncbi:MAG: hypothetical protein DRR06_16295 [Gammaproteobacteria bacterium]|nr:MAG: hypothetical protein DRR06_16295 [Gammaproteobacteria bacterium]
MKVTDNGYYKINGKQGIGGGTSVVYLSGTQGGASTILGYYDDYGDFIPLLDGTLLPGEQYQVDHGQDSLPIYLQVLASSVSTGLSLFVTGKA